MVHLYDALHGSQSRGTLDARRISKVSAEQDWDKPAVPPNASLKRPFENGADFYGETGRRFTALRSINAPFNGSAARNPARCLPAGSRNVPRVSC